MGKQALFLTPVPLIGMVLSANFCWGHPLAAVGSIAQIGGVMAVLGLAFNDISGPRRIWSLTAMVIGLLELGGIIYLSS